MELLFYLRISIIIIYYRKLGFGLSSWHVSPLRLWHVTSLVFFLLLTKFILFIRDFLLFFLKKKTCIYTCHVHNQLIIKYKCWWFHGAGSRWGRGVERSGQFSRVGWRVQKTHITRPWELICLIQLMLRGGPMKKVDLYTAIATLPSIYTWNSHTPLTEDCFFVCDMS